MQIWARVDLLTMLINIKRCLGLEIFIDVWIHTHHLLSNLDLERPRTYRTVKVVYNCNLCVSQVDVAVNGY